MPADLETALKGVCDEKSFIAFIELLRTDYADGVALEKENPRSLYGQSATGWVNGTIDGFLDAAAAWATDQKDPRFRHSNPWRQCAQILYAGKYYE